MLESRASGRACKGAKAKGLEIEEEMRKFPWLQNYYQISHCNITRGCTLYTSHTLVRFAGAALGEAVTCFPRNAIPVSRR